MRAILIMNPNLFSDEMILGLGNDIIEIARIRKAIQVHGHRFCQRLFTKHECAYCLKYKDPVPSFAARFAAKEAIAKALGVGFGTMLAWHDIEIVNELTGKPQARLSSKAHKIFNSPHILLSLSHCDSYAMATAIWLSKKPITSYDTPEQPHI